MALSGRANGTATVTATHAATGMSAAVQVTAETLQNKFYLFQLTPAALSAVFGPIGPMFITVAMVLFAFTTLIGNLYYVDNCLNYIVKKVPAKEFMVLFRIDAMLRHST